MISFPCLQSASHRIFYFRIGLTRCSYWKDTEASCLIRWWEQGSRLRQALVTIGSPRAGHDMCMHWWGCAKWLKVSLKSLSTITSPSNTAQVRSSRAGKTSSWTVTTAIRMEPEKKIHKREAATKDVTNMKNNENAFLFIPHNNSTWLMRLTHKGQDEKCNRN